MSKSWPIALAVIVVGGLAGAAIAGRPDSDDPFVLVSSAAAVVTDAESASTSTTAAAEVVTAVTTTTIEPTTTTTAALVTDTTAPTAPTTTDAAPTTTVVEETTTTIGGPLPPDQFRLVIANGDGRFRLASITADRLSPLGYDIDLGDTLQRVDITTIYFRPGFDDEAAEVANDLEVPGAIIAAFPDTAQPITNSDGAGDVIVVLGADAPR